MFQEPVTVSRVVSEKAEENRKGGTVPKKLYHWRPVESQPSAARKEEVGDVSERQKKQLRYEVDEKGQDAEAQDVGVVARPHSLHHLLTVLVGHKLQKRQKVNFSVDNNRQSTRT